MLPVTSALSTQFSGLTGIAATATTASSGPAGSVPAGSVPAGSVPGVSDTGPAAAPAPFSDLMTDAVGEVNKLETQASTAVSGLISGAGVDVHEAMIATQKAGMAFELTVAVRNKAVQAYQSVLGMQF